MQNLGKTLASSVLAAQFCYGLEAFSTFTGGDFVGSGTLLHQKWAQYAGGYLASIAWPKFPACSPLLGVAVTTVIIWPSLSQVETHSSVR